MVKNLVIIVETLLLLLIAVWYVSYQHVLEQIHFTENLGLIANQTRFMSRVEKRISSGECDFAQKILHQTIAANIYDLKGIVQQLDMSIPKLTKDARSYARILQGVDNDEIAALVEERAAKQEK